MNLKRGLQFFCSVAIAVSALSVASSGSHADSNPPVSPFDLPNLEGNRFFLKDYVGKNVLLISFFATWCEPCAREHRQVQRIYEEYKEKGFLAVAISVDESSNESLVRAYVKRYGLTFPVLLDNRLEVIRLYGSEQALPLTLLVGRDGKIRRIFQGYSAGSEKEIKTAVMQELDLP